MVLAIFYKSDILKMYHSADSGIVLNGFRKMRQKSAVSMLYKIERTDHGKTFKRKIITISSNGRR